MKSLKDILIEIIENGGNRFVISKPALKSQEYKKITAEEKGGKWQISRFTEKQVFHENVEKSQFSEKLCLIIDGIYRQINAWSEDFEHIIMISKKGEISYKRKALKNTDDIKTQPQNTHNRKKKYIIEEGQNVAPLVDMGIFTKEGKIVNSMYDKYKQINRFLEILDDEIGERKAKTLNIIDFGCGKSYLTFIIYYYLTQIKKIEANVIGLDLKKDVIKKCNEAAEKYGYENLKFQVGDINGFKTPFKVDMVLTLHACDTATDYALYNAVSWGAKMIFSVPCCQHELNSQIATEKFSLLTRYGIIKERFSALSTDAIRGAMLEYSGYKTQLLEFVDLSHTPKNILIRAVKRGTTSVEHKEKMLVEAENLIDEFGFKPTIYKLLKQNPEQN